jgi:hypothetical protein
VHIDTLSADKAAQFEGARRAWVDDLHRAQTTDGRGLFLQVDARAGQPARFYTLRPFARMADLDTRREAVAKALASVPKEAQKRYDRLSDESLVFPHASEIWEVDVDLAYAPQEGGLGEETAACARMLVEDVRPDPTSEDRYSKSWTDVKSALTEAHYPLTRLSFRCVYGNGHLVTLWLARSRQELDLAPTAEETVARVRGEARASELVSAVSASVERREAQIVTFRRDLSSTPL